MTQVALTISLRTILEIIETAVAVWAIVDTLRQRRTIRFLKKRMRMLQAAKDFDRLAELAIGLGTSLANQGQEALEHASRLRRELAAARGAWGDLLGNDESPKIDLAVSKAVKIEETIIETGNGIAGGLAALLQKQTAWICSLSSEIAGRMQNRDNA